ncbi:hypothetical protein KTH44_16115 [Acinetobacter bereziniae]|uniref:hypothetical protein n=1 Tax=Acinetobacter bereziniae TaxID=106648 RepID=UPI0021CDCEBD|nr:hypothetical protein [Acinetobacter bereziniae]MCU4320643.1 hypothetical protein [Acinetobacter bereziniae]
MSSLEKMREAFERNLAKKLNMTYEEVKARMDEYEKITGYRYGKNGQNYKDWVIWCEAWQSRQVEVDELQEEYAETELYLRGQLTDRDSKITNLEYLVEQDKSLIPTLNKKLEEKDKRIEMFLGIVEKHKRYIPHSTIEAFKKALGVGCG